MFCSRIKSLGEADRPELVSPSPACCRSLRPRAHLCVCVYTCVHACACVFRLQASSLLEGEREAVERVAEPGSLHVCLRLSAPTPAQRPYFPDTKLTESPHLEPCPLLGLAGVGARLWRRLSDTCHPCRHPEQASWCRSAESQFCHVRKPCAKQPVACEWWQRTVFSLWPCAPAHVGHARVAL